MPQITISGHQFEVPAPFEPSMFVNLPQGNDPEAMASAVNQLMHENLRNNFAKKVKDALGDSEQLPADKHAELQKSLSDYAGEYRFGIRTAGTVARVVDPVEREALRVAKETIRMALRNAKQTATKEAIDEAAHVYLNSEDGAKIRRDAARTVKAQHEAAQKALASLGGLQVAAE